MAAAKQTSQSRRERAWVGACMMQRCGLLLLRCLLARRAHARHATSVQHGRSALPGPGTSETHAHRW